MKRSSKRSREELQREIERTRLQLDAEQALQVPDDLVEFCRSWLGYEPFDVIDGVKLYSREVQKVAGVVSGGVGGI